MKSKYLTCVIAALWFWAPALQLRGIPLWVNLGGGGAPDAPVDPGYDPYTAVFDGTNDYARRTVAVSNIATNPKVFTFACWINTDTDSTVRTVFCIGTGSTNRFQLAVQSTNVFSVFGANSSGTTVLSISSTNTILAAGGWKHVLVCIDMDDDTKTRIYFNGVAETIITATFMEGQTLDLAPSTNPRLTIGGNSSTTPGTVYSGELADLLFEDVYLDDPTKFIVPAGPYPVNPGANGSTAFGAAVPVYLSASGNGNSWANNSGTGGGLTLTGTLGTGTPP